MFYIATQHYIALDYTALSCILLHCAVTHNPTHPTLHWAFGKSVFFLWSLGLLVSVNTLTPQFRPRCPEPRLHKDILH